MDRPKSIFLAEQSRTDQFHSRAALHFRVRCAWLWDDCIFLDQPVAVSIGSWVLPLVTHYLRIPVSLLRRLAIELSADPGVPARVYGVGVEHRPFGAGDCAGATKSVMAKIDWTIVVEHGDARFFNPVLFPDVSRNVHVYGQRPGSALEMVCGH